MYYHRKISLYRQNVHVSPGTAHGWWKYRETWRWDRWWFCPDHDLNACEISWTPFTNSIDHVLCLNGVDRDAFAKCGPHSRYLVNGGICSGFCPVHLSPSTDPKESYVWFSASALEMNGSLTVTVCVFDEPLLSEAAILMSVALLVLDCAFLF